MIRVRFWKLIPVLFLLLLTAEIQAQAVSGREEPLWLRMEKGRTAVRNRELGDALQIFREILVDKEKTGEFVPEAEMWLGYIFEQEGELELAREQYLRALNHAGSLYVAEDEFTILYRLAGIYSNTLQYGKYEQTLKRIVAEGSGTSRGPDPESLAFQEAMLNVLLRNGVDKLFTLYRKDERNLQEAYSELAVYYYRTGLYREAVRYGISALLTPVTNTVAYRREKDFQYEYTKLADFLSDSYRDSYLKGYLEETHFLKNLYYLGSSLHAAGYTTLAREVWQAVVSGAPSDSWRDRSSRQLSSPFIEPLLSPQDWD